METYAKTSVEQLTAGVDGDKLVEGDMVTEREVSEVFAQCGTAPQLLILHLVLAFNDHVYQARATAMRRLPPSNRARAALVLRPFSTVWNPHP